jgi:hypothetical protein
LLGTQQIKSIWSHLQVEFGVRLNGTQTREYSVSPFFLLPIHAIEVAFDFYAERCFYQDPLIDIDDSQPEQVEDLTDDEYLDQMALQQAEQDAAAAKSGKFQPAFRFTFGRRIDGLYAVCVVTQRTYIPADLIFQVLDSVHYLQSRNVLSMRLWLSVLRARLSI